MADDQRYRADSLLSRRRDTTHSGKALESQVITNWPKADGIERYLMENV